MSTEDSHSLEYLHCQTVGSLKSDKKVRISTTNNDNDDLRDKSA